MRSDSGGKYGTFGQEYAAVDRATITIEKAASFAGPDGSLLDLVPGMYRVSPARGGHLNFTSVDRPVSTSEVAHTRLVRAMPTVHQLNLTAPVVLNVSDGDELPHVVMLFPGGVALEATSQPSNYEANVHPTTTVTKALDNPSIVNAVVKWMRFAFKSGLPPFDPTQLLKVPIGKIDPGDSPTRFDWESTPPQWTRGTVATCYVSPAGSAGPLGPQTQTGYVPFPPGTAISRGPYPTHIISVTPVKVDAFLVRPGHSIQLLVTSQVVSPGDPSILSMTWTDVYETIATAKGSVIFPQVIVATGRVPSSPPLAGTSWIEVVAKEITRQPVGTPVEFELQVDGITLATRNCLFKAHGVGTPALTCS